MDDKASVKDIIGLKCPMNPTDELKEVWDGQLSKLTDIEDQDFCEDSAGGKVLSSYSFQVSILT
jgi:hypothetical protein